MGRWKKKKIAWKINNARKKSMLGENERIYNSERVHTPKKIKKRRKIKLYHAKAPRELSINDNPKLVYNYFNNIIEEIKEKKFNELFYFDLYEVEVLTVDAIMYILAIIRNIKSRNIFKYSFKGNQPNNEIANKMLMESGFFKYVRSNNPYLCTDSENIQITSGKLVDGNVVGLICDFVNSKCKTKMIFTDELYEIIIELMTNTIQHAYNDKEILILNQWYIYVGELENKIQFVFLDTGRGIAQTVYKKTIEKFGELFVKEKNDTYYIISALNGEWRSTTAESYRGKGLPSVIEYCKRKEVCNYTITSGRAVVRIGLEGLVEKFDLDNKLFGTLYYWEILKDNIKEEFKSDNN